MDEEIIKQYITDHYFFGEKYLKECAKKLKITTPQSRIFITQINAELMTYKRTSEKLPHENWLHEMKMNEILSKCSQETLKHRNSFK